MTVNHDVVGSSPTCGVLFFYPKNAALAQSVERHLGKVEVAGSIPASSLQKYIKLSETGEYQSFLFLGISNMILQAFLKLCSMV